MLEDFHLSDSLLRMHAGFVSLIHKEKAMQYHCQCISCRGAMRTEAIE